MESTDIDPDQFYSQVEGMTLSEYKAAQMQQKAGGGQKMSDAAAMYSGSGQANEEKFFNKR